MVFLFFSDYRNQITRKGDFLPSWSYNHGFSCYTRKFYLMDERRSAVLFLLFGPKRTIISIIFMENAKILKKNDLARRLHNGKCVCFHGDSRDYLNGLLCFFLLLNFSGSHSPLRNVAFTSGRQICIPNFT